MSIEAKIELAKRAVACPRWRWMPGMLVERERVVFVGSNGVRLSDANGGDRWSVRQSLLPDLDDPATLGCIEHGLLPELWPGCAVTVLRWTGIDGNTYADVDVRELAAPCQMRFGVVDVPLADGLIAALEVAPAKEVTP